MEPRLDLILRALAAHGDVRQLAISLRSKNRNYNFDLQYQRYLKLQCGTMTVLDSDYPDYFRRLSVPPLVLFYYGDRQLFNYPYRLGVVGTRHPTSLGCYAVSHALDWLLYRAASTAREVALVSGMALGIDSLAARQAMKYRQRLITVLGSGLDRPYPESSRDVYDYSREKGLLISEYPFDLCASRRSFPIRNRLIAALSPGLYVPEAKIRSGTYLTVASALEIGRDIATGPGRYDDCDSLNNLLLKEGAELVTSGKELDEFYESSLDCLELAA